MTLPLENLRVVDIGWLMAGPFGARYLADLGADVIKVESGKRLDPLRGLGPYKDGRAGLNRSISYHLINAGKRGIAIDVKNPRGADLIRRLVAGADVFIESFTPGQIDQMGLSYESMSKENPGLIMVSSGLLGRKGTLGLGTSGTGMTGSAYSGATNLVGWPDRPPSGPHGPWTDSVTPRYLAVSVLAALHRRNRTGQGCYIDLAQAECGIQFLAPAFYEYAANGQVSGRVGAHTQPLAAPAGHYPCFGVDRWVAIQAALPEQWSALREKLTPLLDGEEFQTLVGRLRNRKELDQRIASWTATREAREVERILQAIGVPAYVLSQDDDLGSDGNLEALGHYQPQCDPVLGEIVVPGPHWSFENEPDRRRLGPILGSSTDAILREQLDLDDGEIAELREAGVLA